MDLQAVATAATTILGTYFAKTGDGFTKKVGEKLAEQAGALYQTIKQKFQGDSYAEQTLVRTEEQPASDGRQAMLKEVLAEKMEQDEAFAETVQRLVEEARTADIGDVFAFGPRSVAAHTITHSSIMTGDQFTPRH